MENVLRIEKILDFCDVPQLFVARDAFDTLKMNCFVAIQVFVFLPGVWKTF